MKKARLLVGLIAFIGIACLSGALAQARPDDEEVWRAFVTWIRTVPLEANPAGAYALKLQKEGVAEAEIERRQGIIKSMFSSRPEAAEIFYDRTFARPLTGDPSRDGFNSSPSSFLVTAVENLKPGTALDAAMGQGRNAVYLAQKGWTVTGCHQSSEIIVF